MQDQIRWCKRHKVYDSSFNYLTKKFINPIYRMYLKIDWNKARDKEFFEFDDYKKYNILKEAEIKSSFLFKSVDDIKIFCDNLSIINNELKNNCKFSSSLKTIIINNFRQKFNIGYHLLEFLIDADIESRDIISLEFLAFLDQQEKIDKIWNLINSKDVVNKVELQLSFFYSMNQNFITDIQTQQLLDSINNIETSVQMYFPYLAKYLNVDSCIFKKILQLIVSINSEKNISIETSINFFSNYFDYLGTDLEFIKKAYLQQDKIQLNFDYEGNGFLKILKRDNNFLIEYITSLYDKDDYILPSDNRDLGFIWEIDGIETQLIEVFDLIIAKYTYFKRASHFCDLFFRRVDTKYNSKVENFIMEYIKDSNTDSAKMNVIVDIVRYSKNELYDKVLLYYISLNPNKQSFTEIHWRGSETTVIEDGTIGDVEAADWKKILSIVEKSDIGFKLIPIKKYLNDMIESSLRRADGERKQKFLGRH